MSPLRALAVGCLLAALLLGDVEAARAMITAKRSSARLSINPIRRVVTMLQHMQAKVVKEGEASEELFKRFLCFCETGAGDLEKSVAEAEKKVPMLESSLEEGAAKQEQLKKDLVQHRQERTEAEEAMAKATALREKEAEAFTKESTDSTSNIAALGKAITSLEGGVYGFLQTSTGVLLRRLAVDMDMSMSDRDQLTSFLQGQEDESSSPEIIGIIKQMKETMEKELAEATSTEETAKADFEALVAAKEKEVKASQRAIEAKLQREGELGVEIETMKEDMAGTSKTLEQDKKFLAALDGNCEGKKKENEASKTARTNELLALSDAIKILNADTALDLFKKALPSPSLLQMAVNSKEMKKQALEVLKAARHGRKGAKDVRLDLITMALRGRKTSFGKIVTMIDEMLALLRREQSDDDDKKEYCGKELDKSEDEHKELTGAISDLEKASEDTKGNMETLTEEISSLEDGIKALDKQVAEATEDRKAEHKQYREDFSTQSEAKQLLEAASERLAKFYAPAEEQSEEQSEAPSFAQLASRSGSRRVGEVPPPPIDAVAAYKKKGQEGNSVMEMLRILATDIDKEMTEMEVDEKHAQADYEQFVADSRDKRATDADAVSEKEGAKAALEAELQHASLEKKSKTAEASATAGIIRNLHSECDWLLSNFDVRREARAGEADSLKNAKAVLSGADYSLVQMAHKHRERMGRA